MHPPNDSLNPDYVMRWLATSRMYFSADLDSPRCQAKVQHFVEKLSGNPFLRKRDCLRNALPPGV